MLDMRLAKLELRYGLATSVLINQRPVHATPLCMAARWPFDCMLPGIQAQEGVMGVWLICLIGQG